MNKRVLRYETRRIAVYKKYFIFAAGVLILFALCLFIFFAMKETKTIRDFDRAALTEQYRADAETYKKYLAESGEEFTSAQYENMSYKLEELEFFLSTDTVQFDYIQIEEYMDKYKGCEVSAFCFLVCEASLYPFMAISVVCALWAFSFEKSGGILKNLFQGCDRRKIFDGKLLISAALALGLPLLVLLFGTIGTACNGMDFLIHDGGVKVMDNVELFAQLGLRNFVLILFMYAATMFCTTFFKPMISAFVPPMAIIITGLIGMIATGARSMVLLNMHDFEAFNAFPVVGFLNYAGGFDYVFAILAVLHFLAAAAFLIAARARFIHGDL